MSLNPVRRTKISVLLTAYTFCCWFLQPVQCLPANRNTLYSIRTLENMGVGSELEGTAQIMARAIPLVCNSLSKEI